MRNEKTSQRITFSVPLCWGKCPALSEAYQQHPTSKEGPRPRARWQGAYALDQRVRVQAILGGNLPGLVGDPLVEDVVIKMPPAPPLAGVVALQMPGIRDPLTCDTRLRRRIEAY